MKKSVLLLILSCVCGSSAISPAAALPSQDQPSAGAALASPPSPDQVVAMMDKKMSLTDDQKDKLIPIIANRQQQLKALRDDQSIRRFQKLRSAQKIVSDSDKQINAILSAEQQKVYAEMEQQMREQMKERMQNAN